MAYSTKEAASNANEGNLGSTGGDASLGTVAGTKMDAALLPDTTAAKSVARSIR